MISFAQMNYQMELNARQKQQQKQKQKQRKKTLLFFITRGYSFGIIFFSDFFFCLFYLETDD
ncbi:hypothetical protein DOY81_002242, partial [Sarcophaga bullata]